MLTIREYMNKHNMTVAELVRLNDISYETLRKYLKGYPAQPTQHAKLEAVGIKHPKVITTTVRTTKKKSEIKPKEPASKIAPWQTRSVIELGNTIISKDLTKEYIENHFKRHGIKVVCKDFRNAGPGDDTHYVVERVPRNKLGGK